MLRSAWARWWDRESQLVGFESGRASRAELVYASLVPYETATPAARLAATLGIPWVADLQDPWALDEMWLYPTSLHRHVDLRRMRRVLGTAAAIVMNTPEAAVRLQATCPELAEKAVVSIPNGFDWADLDVAAAPGDPGVFRIVHAGYLHTADGLRLRRTARSRRVLGGTILSIDVLTRSHVFLLEAVQRLIDHDPSLAQRIEVVLAGVVNDVDREVAEKYPFVRFTGYLAHEETVALLRSADLLFLPMHDLPAGTRAGLVPGKTYEYLAIGVPILAAVPDGDARDLLSDAGNALICRPSDVAAMASHIADQLTRRAAGTAAPRPRADVLERYERNHLTARLAATFDAVLDQSRAHRIRPRTLELATQAGRRAASG
jgi:glycosyltransferase involved in cell wall biosynthesis